MLESMSSKTKSALWLMVAVFAGALTEAPNRDDIYPLSDEVEVTTQADRSDIPVQSRLDEGNASWSLDPLNFQPTFILCLGWPVLSTLESSYLFIFSGTSPPSVAA